MARLAYPPIDTPQAEQVAAQIRRDRGGRLLNLYRMQLYNPDIARGWLELGSAVRFRSDLDAPTRELAICLVARLTGAEYEWHAHGPLAREAGISEAQLEVLPGWRAVNLFDARQQAVLAATQQLTQQVDMDDATFAGVQAHLAPRQVVELVATVSYYNMVARFLVSLRIDPEAG